MSHCKNGVTAAASRQALATPSPKSPSPTAASRALKCASIDSRWVKRWRAAVWRGPTGASGFFITFAFADSQATRGTTLCGACIGQSGADEGQSKNLLTSSEESRKIDIENPCISRAVMYRPQPTRRTASPAALSCFSTSPSSTDISKSVVPPRLLRSTTRGSPETAGFHSGTRIRSRSCFTHVEAEHRFWRTIPRSP